MKHIHKILVIFIMLVLVLTSYLIHKNYPEIVIISIDIDTTESIEDLKKFKDECKADWFFAMVIINPSGKITYSHTGIVSPSLLMFGYH